jgi:hypothetical protein
MSWGNPCSARLVYPSGDKVESSLYAIETDATSYDSVSMPAPAYAAHAPQPLRAMAYVLSGTAVPLPACSEPSFEVHDEIPALHL